MKQRELPPTETSNPSQPAAAKPSYKAPAIEWEQEFVALASSSGGVENCIPGQGVGCFGPGAPTE